MRHSEILIKKEARQYIGSKAAIRFIKLAPIGTKILANMNGSKESRIISSVDYQGNYLTIRFSNTFSWMGAGEEELSFKNKTLFVNRTLSYKII